MQIASCRLRILSHLAVKDVEDSKISKEIDLHFPGFLSKETNVNFVRFF